MHVHVQACVILHVEGMFGIYNLVCGSHYSMTGCASVYVHVYEVDLWSGLTLALTLLTSCCLCTHVHVHP